MIQGIQFNLNDNAIVELTTYGKEVYKNSFKMFGINPPKQTKKLYRAQLWEIMNIFGSHLYNGSRQVIVKNRITIEKEASQ